MRVAETIELDVKTERELRYHYVRSRVRVHRYVDETLAVCHGPRKLAAYDAKGSTRNKEGGQAGRMRVSTNRSIKSTESGQSTCYQT